MDFVHFDVLGITSYMQSLFPCLWCLCTLTSCCDGIVRVIKQHSMVQWDLLSLLPGSNVCIPALIYYSIWGSSVYVHSAEARSLLCSTEHFQEAVFWKLSRALLQVSFSLPANLLDTRAAPLWSAKG